MQDVARVKANPPKVIRVAEDDSSSAACYSSVKISSPRWRRTAMLKVWFTALGVG